VAAEEPFASRGAAEALCDTRRRAPGTPQHRLADVNMLQSRGEGGLDLLVYKQFFGDAEAGYRQLGWRVHAIEPNPEFCEAHRAAGHEVFEYACADRLSQHVASNDLYVR
jgi:hypothetical protein